MVLCAFAFSLMALLVKLAGQRLPSQQIVLVRALVALILSVAFLRRAGIPLWGHNRRLLLLRGLFGFGGLSCFFYALVHLPLAEATVIMFLSPIFTALLAAVFLGERPTPLLPVALAFGFGGVVLITRPALLFGGASSPFPPGVVLVALCGAFFGGCAYVAVRRLSAGEHGLVIILYFPLIAFPASIPGVLMHDPIWPDGREWLLLIGVGVCAQVAQIFMTRGIKLLPAGTATAIMYLQIVFSALWGALFLAELPDRWTVAGSLSILLGTVIAVRSAAAPAA
ncbi:MAG: DMT family transporter, partial [bacterium]|nr:DMT family transporter [bacterium]